VSAKSPVLNGWVLSLGLLLRKGNHLTAFLVAGDTNVIADALSRNKPINSKWSLDVQSFQWIGSLAPTPLVDLFAPWENHQRATYFSPVLDYLAAGKDAFLANWNQWQCIYLFPPTSMILKDLGKMSILAQSAKVSLTHVHFQNMAPLSGPLASP